MSIRSALVLLMLPFAVPACLPAGKASDKDASGRAPSTVPITAARATVPTPELIPATPGWKLEERYLYNLELASRVAFGNGGDTVDFALKGILELIPVEVSDERITLSLAIDDGRFVSRIPEAQPEFDRLREQLERPYFATLSGGLVTEVRVQQGTDATVVGVYRSLSAALQFARPLQPSETWSAQEYDTTGQYLAVYSAKPEARTYSKKKLRYLTVLVPEADRAKLPADFLPQVVASEGQHQLSATGRPLTVSVKDELLLEGAQAPIRSKISLELQSLSEGPAAANRDSWRATLARTKLLKAEEPFVPPVDAAALDAARIDGMSFEQIANAIDELAHARAVRARARVASGEPEDPELEAQLRDNGKLLAALAATFRRDPQTVRLALSRIRKDSPGKQIFIDALASSGSPAAQAGLIEMLGSKVIDPEQRHNLVLSLSGTPQPSEQSIRALISLLDDERSGTQALFGLGTFSRQLRDLGDHEGAARLGRLLVQRLALARTEFAISRCLRAISNSGYAPALQKIKPFLTDSREQLRSDAIEAVRLMDDPEADRIIASRLEQDPSSRVRLTAIAAAEARTPTDRLVQALTDAALNASDRHVRYRAVERITHWLSKRPGLRPTLKMVTQKESEPQIQQLALAALEES